MIKYVLAFVAAALIFTGCSSRAGDPVVVTTLDNVKKEFVDQAIVVPMESLPKEIAELVPEGSVIVIVEEESWLLDPKAPLVRVGGDPVKDETTFNTLLSTGLGLLTGAVPVLAGWEGVLTLFSRRKRQHYLDSLKKLTPRPGDASIDIVGAVASLGKAIGAGHSSKDSALVFEAETEIAKLT